MNGSCRSSACRGYNPYPGAHSKSAARPQTTWRPTATRSYGAGQTEGRDLQVHASASASVAYYPSIPATQAGTWKPQRPSGTAVVGRLREPIPTTAIAR
eukprot:5321071-Amphidinium_carterae.1